MIAQYFHYKIERTMPLSELENYKDHHRLMVFYHKGCKCVTCGIEGTQLAVGVGRGGTHIDVYTNDFYPLTVDHIIPKSLGGTDNLDNKQPMCCLCNWTKGNGINPVRRSFKKYPDTPIRNSDQPEIINTFVRALNIAIGQTVYRQIKKRVYKKVGIVSEIGINPHTRKMAVKVKDRPDSWFNVCSLYRLQQTKTI